LQLLQSFIEDYIQTDEELLNLVKSTLPSGSFEDENSLLLAQDILYTVLDKENLDSGNEMPAADIEQHNQINIRMSLNTILYGPPGTGKDLQLQLIKQLLLLIQNLM
jgi:5-methylcytosine-specific restriction protein B